MTQQLTTLTWRRRQEAFIAFLHPTPEDDVAESETLRIKHLRREHKGAVKGSATFVEILLIRSPSDKSFP